MKTGCTATKYPEICSEMWRISGRFSGFGGVDVTSGTRSRISGHISARARACMLRDRSAFFGTLFGLLYANFGLLGQISGCVHISERIWGRAEDFGTHLGPLYCRRIFPIHADLGTLFGIIIILQVRFRVLNYNFRSVFGFSITHFGTYFKFNTMN